VILKMFEELIDKDKAYGPLIKKLKSGLE